ncbi:polar amino acid ABC transporter inner membrane subunit [Caballeronia peredens]|nr:polar amino acid ABC transporter inner membrane subunit [Caballeronia peredens]
MDFSFLTQPVATGENTTYLGWVLAGMENTVGVFLLAITITMVVGIALALLKCSGGIAGRIANVVFETIRAVPLLNQLMIVDFVVVPTLFPDAVQHWNQATLTFVIGFTTLGVFMGGRVAAHIYGAIQALPASQMRAATTLGFTKWQAYRYFLLPQALKNIMPTLTSEAMNTVKNSSVIGAIGLLELSKQSQQIIDYTSNSYEAFAIVLGCYLAINLCVQLAMKTIDAGTSKLSKLRQQPA